MDLNDLRKGLASFSTKVNKKLDDISKQVAKIKSSNMVVETKDNTNTDDGIKKTLRSIDDRLRRIENKLSKVDRKIK